MKPISSRVGIGVLFVVALAAVSVAMKLTADEVARDAKVAAIRTAYNLAASQRTQNVQACRLSTQDRVGHAYLARITRERALIDGQTEFADKFLHVAEGFEARAGIDGRPSDALRETYEQSVRATAPARESFCQSRVPPIPVPPELR